MGAAGGFCGHPTDATDPSGMMLIAVTVEIGETSGVDTWQKNYYQDLDKNVFQETLVNIDAMEKGLTDLGTRKFDHFVDSKFVTFAGRQFPLTAGERTRDNYTKLLERERGFNTLSPEERRVDKTQGEG